MRMVKTGLKIVVFFLLFCGILGIAIITKPAKTPLEKSAYYQEWKELIQKVSIQNQSSTDSLLAGWAKVNITPKTPTPLAGYGKRKGKPFVDVLDSVFVRTVVLVKGETRAALVSADLLIIPPTVTDKLKQMLSASDIAYENIYLGATHTHNSVGGWGTGISSLFFSGPYDPQIEVQLAEAILASLRAAESTLEPVVLTYREAIDDASIKNRLTGQDGNIDPEIRSFELTSKNRGKLIFATYGAHSTILNSSTMKISRDWPGVFVDSLEHQADTFGMYMAGAVGSMGPTGNGETDIEAMVVQGNGVYQSFKKASFDTTLATPTLMSLTLPLPLGQPKPRITSQWALRPWVFKKAFGEYPNDIKALRLGNILLVGVPCDFSGELMEEIDRYAKTNGLNLIVTGFNGGYMGYITDDRWYEHAAYETVTMNWYGPHKGAYFQEVIKDLVEIMK